MKSLDDVTEDNRKQARNLMLDNNINHISIKDNKMFGLYSVVPMVYLMNKDIEPYKTDVTDIKLCAGDIYIKVDNTEKLISNSFVDGEGYLNISHCISYTENEVYKAIEDYCEKEFYLGDKINTLEQEIEQKFIRLLLDEDKRTFNFKKYYVFGTYIEGVRISIRSIYFKDNCVMLETSEGVKFSLCDIDLNNSYNLLTYFKKLRRDKC